MPDADTMPEPDMAEPEPSDFSDDIQAAEEVVSFDDMFEDLG